MKNKILVILGPTATGKSELAVELALIFNGEVISADSRQVYRGMDIGTGKITPTEMRGIPHHLLDVADPRENFSVADYQALAKQVVQDIRGRRKLPILCGGTGLYIKAVTQEMELPNVKPNYELREELDTWDTSDLVAELERLDPRRAALIDTQNRRRLIRAIEIAKELGSVPGNNFADLRSSIFDCLYIGLTADAEILRARIHDRLLARLKAGMVEEVEKLHLSGVSWKRLESFGLEYKYIAMHLQKIITQEHMVIKLDTEIWQYAKRQMTWFKKFAPDTKWFRCEERARIEHEVRLFLA